MTSASLSLPELGLTLAVYEAGNPTSIPLLSVHGNSLAADSFTAQFAAPELRRFRLVAFDWPGHGLSAPAPALYRPAGMGQVLVAAVQALRCEQAVAVAHSHGGNLFLKY